MNTSRNTLAGIGLAVLATLIWSGNFIVARGASHQVPPVTLAFLRWSCASVIILPLGYSATRRDWPLIKKNWLQIVFAAITGISLFNTLVYVAAHYSEAINLALIGTTSSPVFSFLLARIFLKERITRKRLAGLLLCLAGILLLLSRGSWQVLLHFRFSEGDWWVLGAAFSFAVYNILARKKAAGISGATYLLVTFWVGTLILLPFAWWEQQQSPALMWNAPLMGIIFYLGAGTSVAAFYCWNIAIAYLGAARTAIFGNLIPIFSSLEAVLILGEKITAIHVGGMVLVIAGVVMANWPPPKKKPTMYLGSHHGGIES